MGHRERSRRSEIRNQDKGIRKFVKIVEVVEISSTAYGSPFTAHLKRGGSPLITNGIFLAMVCHNLAIFPQRP